MGSPVTPFIYVAPKKMKAHARSSAILTVVYFSNKPSILDVKFANLGPLLRHLCGTLSNTLLFQ